MMQNIQEPYENIEESMEQNITSTIVDTFSNNTTTTTTISKKGAIKYNIFVSL